MEGMEGLEAGASATSVTGDYWVDDCHPDSENGSSLLTLVSRQCFSS